MVDSPFNPTFKLGRKHPYNYIFKRFLDSKVDCNAYCCLCSYFTEIAILNLKTNCIYKFNQHVYGKTSLLKTNWWWVHPNSVKKLYPILLQVNKVNLIREVLKTWKESFIAWWEMLDVNKNLKHFLSVLKKVEN